MGFFDFLFGSRKPTNVEVAPERTFSTPHPYRTGLDCNTVQYLITFY